MALRDISYHPTIKKLPEDDKKTTINLLLSNLSDLVSPVINKSFKKNTNEKGIELKGMPMNKEEKFSDITVILIENGTLNLLSIMFLHNFYF